LFFIFRIEIYPNRVISGKIKAAIMVRASIGLYRGSESMINWKTLKEKGKEKKC